MWELLLYFVLAEAVVYFLAPKQRHAASPSGVNSVRVPTAEDGREIPVLFGTKDIGGPNVVWYGDLRTVAVKKSGGGGKK